MPTLWASRVLGVVRGRGRMADGSQKRGRGKLPQGRLCPAGSVQRTAGHAGQMAPRRPSSIPGVRFEERKVEAAISKEGTTRLGCVHELRSALSRHRPPERRPIRSSSCPVGLFRRSHFDNSDEAGVEAGGPKLHRATDDCFCPAPSAFDVHIFAFESRAWKHLLKEPSFHARAMLVGEDGSRGPQELEGVREFGEEDWFAR
mmetsp:Transcript_43291/g.97825  ORF Transcript_43291/g.97825 Transcript_43291/m.97825 type:complete len:202 (-) Transcript_43291:167-772(-)